MAMDTSDQHQQFQQSLSSSSYHHSHHSHSSSSHKDRSRQSSGHKDGNSNSNHAVNGNNRSGLKQQTATLSNKTTSGTNGNKMCRSISINGGPVISYGLRHGLSSSSILANGTNVSKSCDTTLGGGNNKSLIFVKLTDSSLKAIEDYITAGSTCKQQSSRPMIQFEPRTNQGVITIPSNIGKNISSDSAQTTNDNKRFNFSVTKATESGPKGSFECLRHARDGTTSSTFSQSNSSKSTLIKNGGKNSYEMMTSSGRRKQKRYNSSDESEPEDGALDSSDNEGDSNNGQELDIDNDHMMDILGQMNYKMTISATEDSFMRTKVKFSTQKEESLKNTTKMINQSGPKVGGKNKNSIKNNVSNFGSRVNGKSPMVNGGKKPEKITVGNRSLPVVPKVSNGHGSPWNTNTNGMNGNNKRPNNNNNNSSSSSNCDVPTKYPSSNESKKVRHSLYQSSKVPSTASSSSLSTTTTTSPSMPNLLISPPIGPSPPLAPPPMNGNRIQTSDATEQPNSKSGTSSTRHSNNQVALVPAAKSSSSASSALITKGYSDLIDGWANKPTSPAVTVMVTSPPPPAAPITVIVPETSAPSHGTPSSQRNTRTNGYTWSNGIKPVTNGVGQSNGNSSNGYIKSPPSVGSVGSNHSSSQMSSSSSASISSIPSPPEIVELNVHPIIEITPPKGYHSSSSSSKRLTTNFTKDPRKIVSTIEERDSLKERFDEILPEYKTLQNIMDAVTRRFTKLESKLREEPEGTRDWNRIMELILKEYDSLKKDEKYKIQKKRHEELYRKLSDLKRMIQEFDARAGKKKNTTKVVSMNEYKRMQTEARNATTTTTTTTNIGHCNNVSISNNGNGINVSTNDDGSTPMNGCDNSDSDGNGSGHFLTDDEIMMDYDHGLTFGCTSSSRT